MGSDGSISKQRVLAPKCNTVPHCIVDNFENEITDERSICEEYRREFIHRLRACSHEPGAVNYPGVMIAPGQALPRVHMMICCPGATLPRVNFIAPGQVHRQLIITNLSGFL